MNCSRRNHKKIESTLIVRLSMLLVLMFGSLGATQAQWSSSSGNTTTNDKVGIGTTSPIAPLDVIGRTTRFSNFQPTYRLDYGGGDDLGWKTIANVTLGTGLYVGVNFEVRVLDAQNNWGISTDARLLRYYVYMARSGGTQDDVNGAQVSGPVANYVRVMKTATGVYELQIKQIQNWQRLKVEATAYAINSLGSGGSVAYVDNPSAGSSSGTEYNPSPLHSEYLPNLSVSGTGTIGGNVGVGTTSPGAKLDISAVDVYPLIVRNSDASSGYGASVQLINSGTGGRSYTIGSSSNQNGAVSGGKFYLKDETANAYRLLIDSSGNVGIGTTSPQGKLHVANGTAGTGILIDGFTPATNPTIANNAGNEVTFRGSGGNTANGIAYNFVRYDTAASFLAITNSGNVGIGTTNPSSFGAFAVRKGISVSGITGSVSGHFSDAATGSVYISHVSGYSNISADTALAFSTGSNPAERVRIDSSGNVGIGTPSPGDYKLNVNGNTNVTGNITATGNISAKYQDVAEWVPSSEQLSAGTVVVLDSTKSNQVTSSSVSYDTRVAGVISEQPGIALGEKSEGKVLVATTGRVRVKVDASKSPINIGDLLVTSDVSGFAMKSEPVNLGGIQLHRPGTLIGKAQEPLEKGKGEILVLLSLQ